MCSISAATIRKAACSSASSHDLSAQGQIIGGDGLSNTEFWSIGTEAAAGTVFTNASDATKNARLQGGRRMRSAAKNIPPKPSR